jgi:hypothetical protein
MMRVFFRPAGGSLVIWMLLGVAPAIAQFQDLVSHLPTTGNTLVLIDADRIYRSELARREHWQADHARGTTAGGLLLPPGTQRLAAAANLDLEFLEPLWEAGVLRLAAAPPLDEIAKAEHGTLDEINGHSAVILPGDACLVTFDARHLGVIAPANRQRVAQWLTFNPAASDSPLPAYFQRVLAEDNKHPAAIVIAFDLSHAVSPAVIKTHVAAWSGERLSGVSPDDLAAMLTSMAGATVEIHVGDGIIGRLRIDFAANVSRLAPIAKDLVLETLSGSGAMVPELRDWAATTEEHAIVLQGKATPRAVERALSIVQLPLWPLEHHAAATSTAPPAPVAASPMPVASRSPPPAASPPKPPPLTPATASSNYFRAVRRLLGDLKEDRKDSTSMGQIGLWYDTYARKIDMLPQLQVDPALLDYGSQVSSGLRSAATAVKQGGINAHQREMQITPLNTTTARFSRPSYGYGGYSRYGRYGYHRGYRGYGGYGRYGGVIGTYYFQSRNVSSERRKVRADERAKMATSVIQILSEIDAATAKVRQEMIEKYGDGF